VKLRIFVDQCSIEVFVNDGERVLSSLIFPETAHRDLELFSSFGPSTLQSLKAWPLATIWP
jgi:fructan beta-fructosidase